MMRGKKDLCGVSARKRNNEKTINNDVTFIVLQKNMRSMHSSERIEEMVYYYCVKRGGMTKKKDVRHIINTFSWVQENTTTNTALVCY